MRRGGCRPPAFVCDVLARACPSSPRTTSWVACLPAFPRTSRTLHPTRPSPIPPTIGTRAARRGRRRRHRVPHAAGARGVLLLPPPRHRRPAGARVQGARPQPPAGGRASNTTDGLAACAGGLLGAFLQTPKAARVSGLARPGPRRAPPPTPLLNATPSPRPQVLEVLCACSEYDELPVRHNEDRINAELSKEVGVFPFLWESDAGAVWEGCAWLLVCEAGLCVCFQPRQPPCFCPQVRWPLESFGRGANKNPGMPGGKRLGGYDDPHAKVRDGARGPGARTCSRKARGRSGPLGGSEGGRLAHSPHPNTRPPTSPHNPRHHPLETHTHTHPGGAAAAVPPGPPAAAHQ